MTADEFAAVIRQVEGFWPNKTFEVGTLDVWWSQMQAWNANLVLAALPKLARELTWLPSFSQLATAYSIEVTLRDTEIQKSTRRHLSVVSDPELRERWRRVIRVQLRSFGVISEPSPVSRAVKRHYRRDSTGLVVLDGNKMLLDAEQAIAEDSFGTGGD